MKKVPLSPTQATLLETSDINRLASATRELRCGSVCGLRISVDEVGKEAHITCENDCDGSGMEFAASALPALANTKILDSSLVSEDLAISLENAAYARPLVVAEAHECSGNTPILSGVAATVIRSSGYVNITPESDDSVLIYAKPANGASIIEAGTPVLVEQVTKK